MKKMTKPTLAFSALRVNGGYTPAMDRTLCNGNIKDLERRGYTTEEAAQILEATVAAHQFAGRYPTTKDLHLLFKMGFECIEIKSESAFRNELDRNHLTYTFDATTNMFTII